MYLEAVFCFYILLNHLVGYSLFWLITFCSLFNIIKRNFALTLAKLYFYIDYAVRFFVGKKYNRLHDGIQKKSVHPVDHAAPQALRDRINDLRNATGNRGSREKTTFSHLACSVSAPLK